MANDNSTIRNLNILSMYLGPLALLLGAFIVMRGGVSVGDLLGALFLFAAGASARRFLHPERKSGKGLTIAANVLALLLVAILIMRNENAVGQVIAHNSQTTVRLIAVLGPAAAGLIVLATVIIVIRTPSLKPLM